MVDVIIHSNGKIVHDPVLVLRLYVGTNNKKTQGAVAMQHFIARNPPDAPLRSADYPRHPRYPPPLPLPHHCLLPPPFRPR